MQHLLATILALFVAAGPATAAAQPPMPAPRSEAAPSPRTGSTWQPGQWHWNGDRYVWFDGHWSDGNARYGHFVQGHWGWNDGHWAWRPAHWE